MREIMRVYVSYGSYGYFNECIKIHVYEHEANGVIW